MYTYTRRSVHLSVLRASLSDTQPIQIRPRDDEEFFRRVEIVVKMFPINFLILTERRFKKGKRNIKKKKWTFLIASDENVQYSC